jgi:alkylation response protein AidB-like acyl-CoA dehydrogenase
VLKLASAEHAQRVTEFAVDLLGMDGGLISDYEPRRPGLPIGGDAPHDTTKAYLRSRANTIEGGTSEILRNILGERVLGLPGDIRVDKGVPWRDIPR